MRWKNTGHEFEQYVKDICLTKYEKNKYYIFGAGQYGRELLAALRLYEFMVTFIDNNVSMQGEKIDDIDVISLEEYLSKKDGRIVITASKENSKAIIKQLESYSLQQGIDFFLYREFIDRVFPIISVYCYNKSFVSLAQISVTERCSLKCKKCAHGCYAVDNKSSEDLTLAQIYKSADSFFSKVDFIQEFVLIGGEPLLHKDLSNAISYIGKNYRSQIGIFSITTNGTIVPGDDVLEACQLFNVIFRISNYAGQIPRLKNSYQRLMDKLERYNVPYILGKEETEWIDYGFEYIDRRGTEDELIEVFDTCHTPCREVRENRFYYCVMARSVSDNLGFNIGQNDYLDLDSLEGNDYKKKLLEFTLGYSEKGYLDMCNYCHGAEARNYLIPAAEQI